MPTNSQAKINKTKSEIVYPETTTRRVFGKGIAPPPIRARFSILTFLLKVEVAMQLPDESQKAKDLSKLVHELSEYFCMNGPFIQDYVWARLREQLRKALSAKEAAEVDKLPKFAEEMKFYKEYLSAYYRIEQNILDKNPELHRALTIDQNELDVLKENEPRKYGAIMKRKMTAPKELDDMTFNAFIQKKNFIAQVRPGFLKAELNKDKYTFKAIEKNNLIALQQSLNELVSALPTLKLELKKKSFVDGLLKDINEQVSQMIQSEKKVVNIPLQPKQKIQPVKRKSSRSTLDITATALGFKTKNQPLTAFNKLAVTAVALSLVGVAVIATIAVGVFAFSAAMISAAAVIASSAIVAVTAVTSRAVAGVKSFFVAPKLDWNYKPGVPGKSALKKTKQDAVIENCMPNLGEIDFESVAAQTVNSTVVESASSPYARPKTILLPFAKLPAKEVRSEEVKKGAKFFDPKLTKGEIRNAAKDWDGDWAKIITDVDLPAIRC